jgi:hypothetical protein
LLPRTLFSDEVKPGDTITLKVSAVYGDEVEVSATATPGEEPEMEEQEQEEQPPMMTAEIATSSSPSPAAGKPEFVRPSSISPARPASAPQST